MQKINLEALESKNMTVASEDILSEVNGGCTFKVGYHVNNCGRRTYYIMSAVACGNGPCLGQVANDWAAYNHYAYGTKLDVWKDDPYKSAAENTLWHVRSHVNGYTYVVEKNGSGRWTSVFC